MRLARVLWARRWSLEDVLGKTVAELEARVEAETQRQLELERARAERRNQREVAMEQAKRETLQARYANVTRYGALGCPYGVGLHQYQEVAGT
ncbi:MAG: hypothetical protein DLM55_03415 [Acidimicrobiales bacterium]|nr:MAG: hypothetical protein DLM55_03415 [Acidimicrobiales bacterium]